jgi:hypothetical protein
VWKKINQRRRNDKSAREIFPETIVRRALNNVDPPESMSGRRCCDSKLKKERENAVDQSAAT